MLYIDIDGVLRDMDKIVCGGSTADWERYVDGVPYCDWIEKNLMSLVHAPKTEHCDAMMDAISARGLEFKILSCQPETWRGNTLLWLIQNKIFFKAKSVIFVDETPEKLKYLNQISDLLIDDYPKFTDYKSVALVMMPYNKSVISAKAYISNREDIYKVLDDYERRAI